MEAGLRRGLFGYSRKSVTAVVNDREVSITKASRAANEAEDQVAKLTAEIEENRREIVDLQARNRDLDSKLEDAAERLRAVERSGSTSTTEELTDVLHAAERALARLSDRARENAEQQLGETERVRDSLRSEIDRLAAWRARMAPLADSIPSSIEEVQKEASAMAARLREAISPATNALDALAARLAELVESPEPPEQRPVTRDEVISLEEASFEPGAEAPDTGLGAFAWPPDRPAAPSGE